MSSPSILPPNQIRGSGPISAQQVQREQAAARMQALEQEQARKQQDSEQKRQQEQARLDAIRAANSRVASDPLAQQGRFNADVSEALKTGSTIKTLKEMGYDVDTITFSGGKANPTNIQGTRFVPQTPKAAPQIDYEAETKQDFESFKAAAASGKTPLNFTVTRNYGNANSQQVNALTGRLVPLSTQIEYTRMQTTPSPRSSDIDADRFVNELEGAAKFVGSKTEFGYSISKDKNGNVTAASGSLFFPAGVNISTKDVEAGYAHYKALQTLKPNEVLGGAGPIETEYYIPDITNPYQIQTKNQYLDQNYTIPDITNPFKIEPKVKPEIVSLDRTIPKPTNPVTDYGAGFESYFRDLAGPLTGEKKYSVEGEFFGSFKGGSGLKTGFTLFTPQNVKGLVQTGESVAKNPSFAAGSLVGSATLFVGSGGIGNVGKVAGRGVKNAAERIAPKITDIIGSRKAFAEVGSNEVFKSIQEQRPETSIFKTYVNYEKAPELKEIARQFDMAAPTRTGAIATDEVTITKEFARAPTNRFTEEIRPTVFGQKEPIPIEEELELVRLNPSRPSKMPSLSDIVKFNPGSAPVKAGSPFTLAPDESHLPKLGDIMKKDLFKGPAVEGSPIKLAPDESHLPKLSDMVKFEAAKPRPTEGAPFALSNEGNLPKLGDIMKSNLWKGLGAKEGAPFTLARDESNLPKLSDIVRPFRRGKRSQKVLSGAEVNDLFDTLEGKKAIEPARNLMTRKEQGRFAGELDLDKEISKQAKNLVKTVKPKARKETIDITKESKGFEIASGSGRGKQSLILEKKPETTTRRTLKKQLEEITGSRKTPKGFPGPEATFRARDFTGGRIGSFGEVGLIGRQNRDTFESSITRDLTKNLIKPQSKGRSNALVRDIVDIGSRSRNGYRLGESSIPKEVQKSFEGLKISTGTKQVSGLRFGNPLGSPGSNPFASPRSRSRTQPKFDIPTIKIPKNPPIPKAFFSSPKAPRRKGGKTKAGFRTYVASDVIGAFLGSDSSITKGFNKNFGKLY